MAAVTTLYNPLSLRCMLVFDVSDQSSFDALDGWVQEAKQHGLKSAPVVVCANKVGGCGNGVRGGDQPQATSHMRENSSPHHPPPKVDMKRKITEREGREWAESYGYRYFETSAQSGAK